MNENATRSLSGLVYVAVLLTATFLSEISFKLLFGCFLIIAVIEFCKLINLSKTIPLIIAITGYVLFGVFHNSSFQSNIMLAGASVFVTTVLIADLFKKKHTVFRDSSAKYVLLTGYVIIPFLLIIKFPFINNVFNPVLLACLFLLIWINDSFAYIVGRAIGKTKLFERVSPKKTVEGFAGGLLFTIAGSFILSLLFTSISLYIWIISAVILVIFGTLGDLAESKFKRSAGVKDSGKIMPGHGGILDRLDSIIFAIPFLFLFYQIMFYVS